MSAAAARRAPGCTVDAFLGGKVTLIQPRSGHRAGLDAALLQALVPADAKGVAVDLGTGVGGVAFSVAARAPGISIRGIERDRNLVACGREALALPGNAAFAERVLMIDADAAHPETWLERAGLAKGKADFVLMNPPFDQEGRVRRSPDAGRSAAHVAHRGLLRDWCVSADAVLRPGGTLALIHRPSALTEIVAALGSRFGGVRLRPVHPFEGAVASRILVTARRGRKAPLEILPRLVLHEPGGGWTPAAQAILQGRPEPAS